MAVDYLDVLQGSFTILFMIITITVGVLIFSKYFEHRKRELLLVGIAWICLPFPWIPDVSKFIINLTNISVNNQIMIIVYIITNVIVVPIPILCWLIAITNMLTMKIQTRKVILIIFAVLSAIFEVIVIYYLITDIHQIGTFSGPFLIRWALYVELTFIIFISVVLITGILFARESIRSDNPEIKLKGKFLLAAFISLSIGGILDVMFTDVITNVASRLILMMTSILFYFGLMLPEKIKEILLK